MTSVVKEAIMAFDRTEASGLSGLTEHQLRAWSRNLYAPEWRASGFYSFVDLVALRTLGKLRKDFRVRPRELRRVGDYLRKHSDKPWSKLKLGVGPKNRIYFWDPVAKRWLSADGVQQSITVVALDQLAAKLTREVRAARARPKPDLGQFEKARGVCGGRLRFKGTRVTVDAVKSLLHAGQTTRQILAEFPSLSARDVAAARNLHAA